MIFTPDHLHATYDFMRHFKPFCRWKLPPGDEIAFKLTLEQKTSGYCQPDRDQHWIAVSHKCAGTIYTLQRIMGHEMIHLKQMLAKTETNGAEHNAEFRELAKNVCREWNWDVLDFYF